MLGILETTTILFAYEKIHQLKNIRKIFVSSSKHYLVWSTLRKKIAR